MADNTIFEVPEEVSPEQLTETQPEETQTKRKTKKREYSEEAYKKICENLRKGREARKAKKEALLKKIENQDLNIPVETTQEVKIQVEKQKREYKKKIVETKTKQPEVNQETNNNQDLLKEIQFLRNEINTLKNPPQINKPVENKTVVKPVENKTVVKPVENKPIVKKQLQQQPPKLVVAPTFVLTNVKKTLWG